jgi:hypothetical protein
LTQAPQRHNQDATWRVAGNVAERSGFPQGQVADVLPGPARGQSDFVQTPRQRRHAHPLALHSGIVIPAGPFNIVMAVGLSSLAMESAL